MALATVVAALAAGCHPRSNTRPPSPRNFVERALMSTLVFVGDPDKGLGDPDNVFGGGALVSSSGFGVTNYHVLKYAIKAERFGVLLCDGTALRLDGVVALDRDADWVVVKVSAPWSRAEPLPSLSIGDSKGLQTMQAVYALGSPGGLTCSASWGSVSHPARKVPRRSTEVIQHTAPVSPGSSGGPLVDESGALVGLVIGSWGPASEARNQNVNFAVPAHLVAVPRGPFKLHNMETFGDYVKAADLYEDDKPQDAAEAARETIKKDPVFGEAVEILGDALLKAGHVREAAAQFSEAADLSAGDAKKALLGKLGMAFVRAADRGGARVAWTRLKALDPEAGDNLLKEILLSDAWGEPGKGRELTTIEWQVRNKYGMRALKVYSLIDGKKTALEIMKEADVTQDEMVGFLEGFEKDGIVHLEYPGKTKAAAPSEEKAEDDEKTVSLRLCLHELYLEYMKLGKHAKAAAVIRELTEIEKNRDRLAMHYRNLGLAQYAMNRPAQALAAFEKAAALARRLTAGELGRRGAVMLSLGRFAEARRDYLAAREIYEKNEDSDDKVLAGILLGLTVAEHKLGNRAGAREAAERLLGVDGRWAEGFVDDPKSVWDRAGRRLVKQVLRDVVSKVNPKGED